MSEPFIHYDRLIRTRALEPFHGPIMSMTRTAYAKLGAPDVFSVSPALMGSLDMPPAVAIMYESAFWYEQSGQQSFVVGPGMWEMFKETGLENIKREHLKMPYRCFWVATPHADVHVWGGQESGWHPLSGFYVHEHPSGQIYIFIYGKTLNKNPLDDASAWLRVDPKEVWGVHGNIEAYLADMLKDPTGSAVVDDESYRTPKTVENDQRSRNLLTYVARCAFNLCMYLQTLNKDLSVNTPADREAAFNKRWRHKKNKTKGKPGHERKQMDRMKDTTFTHLAPKIEEEWARLLDGEGGQRTQRATARRIWVRGHFRRVVVGKRADNERAWRWIAPYVKGPEGVEASSREYRLTP